LKTAEVRLANKKVTDAALDVFTTEQEPTAPRRWSAFVCPDCRFVFRLSRDHDGKGMICPSCRRMLRIPHEGEGTAPLVIPQEPIDSIENERTDPRDDRRSRSKRKKKAKEAETPDWEASAGTWRSKKNKNARALRAVAIWTTVITAIFGSAFFLFKEKNSKAFVENKAEQKEITNTPLLLPDEELDVSIELPKIMRRSQSEFLSLAKPNAEKFLAATRVDQILPLVRDSEKMRAKIYTYYPNGKIQATAISKFNVSGQVSYKDSFAAVSILTTDFEGVQLAFFDGKDGLKIDWESWVGWSEMPWEQIIETKPQRPILIRAKLKTVDYYNFGFADDSKWRAYRLSSPDGAHTLYGYIERNSLLDQRLRPPEKSASSAVTLKIRFPEGKEQRNQVVIHDMVADGWVLPETK
jgi:hypothetical protein